MFHALPATLCVRAGLVRLRPCCAGSASSYTLSAACCRAACAAAPTYFTHSASASSSRGMSQPARRAGEPTACERSLWRLCTADNPACQRTALSPQGKQMQTTPKAGTLRQAEAQERGPAGRPRASQLATALVRAASGMQAQGI